MMHEFPSVAQMSVQSFESRRAGKPIAIEAITQFSSSARSVQPRLTDRAACVLYVVAKNPCISVQDVEYAIAAKHGVVYAVLRGLHDLGLIEVTGAGWLKTVALTDAGKAFVQPLQ